MRRYSNALPNPPAVNEFGKNQGFVLCILISDLLPTPPPTPSPTNIFEIHFSPSKHRHDGEDSLIFYLDFFKATIIYTF